jgi:hypothetical protein
LQRRESIAGRKLTGDTEEKPRSSLRIQIRVHSLVVIVVLVHHLYENQGRIRYKGNSATKLHRYKYFGISRREMSSISFICGRQTVSEKEEAS